MATTPRATRGAGTRAPVAFEVSFKDLDDPAKFTINPRLPVIDSSKPWSFVADLDRGARSKSKWQSVTLKDFRFVEPGVRESSPVTVSVKDETNIGVMRPVPEVRLLRSCTTSRYVAFTVVFRAADGKIVEIDPIYIENPGDP